MKVFPDGNAWRMLRTEGDEMGALRRSILFLLSLAAAALTVSAGASAGPALSTTVPLTYEGFNTCTAEAFTGTGTAHVVLTENLSSSGVLQYHLQSTIDGLQAVTVTGKRYVVQDIFFEEFVFAGATAEDTFDMTFHYVRVGEDSSFVLGDDFYVYTRAHITANATGFPSFQMRTSDMPCQ